MFNEKVWRQSEKSVQDYMKKEGYNILYTNFSCVNVELDIVSILPKKVQLKLLKNSYKTKTSGLNRKERTMLLSSLKSLLKTVDDLLVITEVKGRDTNEFGSGLDAISEQKKQNIIRGARFLLTDKKFSKFQIRFDVASVDDGKITYIENAF